MGKGKKRSKWLGDKQLPELREWLNVFVGVSALLLAFVSFWTTARISGLEDYLRSEISRRNTELDTLAEKSGSIERLAAERERQLASLDAATNEILAASLSAQSQLAESQSDLAEVRSRVSLAQGQLADAEAARERLRVNFSKQSREFEQFQRQQAFQLASLRLRAAYRLFFVRNDDPPTASQTLDTVERLSAPQNQPALNSYFAIIREQTERVCPNFRQLPVNLPPVPIPAGEAPRSPRITRMSDPAYLQWKEDYAAWGERNDRYWEMRSAYGKARIDEQYRLFDEAEKCMCKALAGPDFPADTVCVAEEF